MTISVDIADRLYDYTDEDKAAEAVATFQVARRLDDEAVLAVWADEGDLRRVDLERAIFEAVDSNGTVRRAKGEVPSGVSLSIVSEVD